MAGKIPLRGAGAGTGEELEAESSSAPDTVLSPPPTPIPATTSIEVNVSREFSDEPESQAARTQASLTADEATITPSSSSKLDALKETTKSNSGVVLAKIDPSRVSGHQNERSKTKGSNTTLQSMMRPEVTQNGVPHTRRFLSIERELEQCSASIKLLEKQLKAVRREARIGWAIAGLVVLAALGTASL